MINNNQSRRTFLRHSAIIGAVSFATLGSGCAQYIDEPEIVSSMVMEEAVWTLRNFRAKPDLSIIDDMIPDAHGIIIFPRVVKGGFFVGVESGTGVMLVRKGDQWSYPAFYLLSAGSIGFQAGLQETEIIMIIRNKKALDAVIEHQGKIGAEMGIMMGWHGVGYEGATTTSLGADIVAYTGPGFGLYGGVALEGAALVRRTDLNEFYYGLGATPRSIFYSETYKNPAADSLRSAINP